MFKIILLPEAEKFYKKISVSDRSHFTRIANALISLQNNPWQGKILKHKLKGKFSLRVGNYRIIYAVDQKIVTVFIFDIGHRREIYQ